MHETETLLGEPAPEAAPAAQDTPAPAVHPALFADLRPGEVNVLGPVETPGFAPRHLRVYLPRAFTPEEPRFLLVMFDGQNLFDDAPSLAGGWHLHEAVEKLERARRPAPIVVGIDHGGGERLAELAPFPHADQEGRLDAFLGWTIGALLPALGASLPLHPPQLGVAVGGSSLGGLAALYAHFRHPEIFGGALVMSPSIQLADRAIFDHLLERPTPPVSRIYLDAGAREGRGTLLPLAAAMAAHLASRGYDEGNLMWRPDPRGAHNEASWRRRLSKALRFMYRPDV